jgi:hypothetical protein
VAGVRDRAGLPSGLGRRRDRAPLTRAALALVAATLVGCAEPPKPVPTVTRAETPELAARVAGTLVWTRPVGGVVGVTLPDLRPIVVLPYWDEAGGPRAEYPGTVVETVGGPDEQGRVVYVEGRSAVLAGRDKYRLRLVGADGRGDRVIAPVPSTAGSYLGKTLALAPRGGRAALLSRTRGARIEGRPHYLGEGPLHVWDVDAGRELPLQTVALDAGLSWAPDGRTLYHVAAAARDAIPARLFEGADALGGYAGASHAPPSTRSTSRPAPGRSWRWGRRRWSRRTAGRSSWSDSTAGRGGWISPPASRRG